MIKQPLSHLALSDNGFLFDTTTGYTYTLNKVATSILKDLISEKEMDDILDHLLSDFDISFEVAQRDAEMFVSQLHELGLIGEQE